METITSAYAILSKTASFSQINSAEIAVIASAIFAGLSVFYLAFQIYSSIRQQRIQRAWEYMRAHNDPNFIPIKSIVPGFFRNQDLTEEEKLFLLYDKEGEKTEDKVEKINNSPIYQTLNNKLRYWLDLPNGVRITSFHITDFRSKIITYFNYFEILGLFYAKKEIDRFFVKDFFEEISPYVFESVKFLIDKKRKIYNNDLYRRWEDMNDKIKIIKK